MQAIRVLAVHPRYGWLEESAYYTPEGTLLAKAVASQHRYDPATETTLPSRIQVGMVRNVLNSILGIVGTRPRKSALAQRVALSISDPAVAMTHPLRKLLPMMIGAPRMSAAFGTCEPAHSGTPASRRRRFSASTRYCSSTP
jgi:hypothetical protein